MVSVEKAIEEVRAAHPEMIPYQYRTPNPVHTAGASEETGEAAGAGSQFQ